MGSNVGLGNYRKKQGRFNLRGADRKKRMKEKKKKKKRRRSA